MVLKHAAFHLLHLLDGGNLTLKRVQRYSYLFPIVSLLLFHDRLERAG